MTVVETEEYENCLHHEISSTPKANSHESQSTYALCKIPDRRYFLRNAVALRLR
jgi:hypothetical protein